MSNAVKRQCTRTANQFRRSLTQAAAAAAATLMLCPTHAVSETSPITWNTVDGKRRAEFILNSGHICVLEDDQVICIARPHPRPETKR